MRPDELIGGWTGDHGTASTSSLGARGALGMWRYLSYSPPENRQPLRLQEVQLGRSTDREERAWQWGEPGVLFSHHCYVTPTVTIML